MKSLEHDIYLFQRLKKGKISAFEKLFEKYYEPLCNFAFLFLKDDRYVEEVVDDVFIHIWENREKLFVHTNVRSYLYRSTRNRVVSFLRKDKFGTDTFEIIENKNQGFKRSLSPETLMIREEIASKVAYILQQLPPQAGLVFRLHKMEGMRYKEIAEILDISVKTVENHMGRALRIFRKIYEENANFFDD